MAKTGKRSLIVTECKLVYTGQGDKGEYQIFEVEATTDDGTPVGLPLRSFSDLAAFKGKVTEFEVQPYEKPGKPTTYTLKAPKGSTNIRVAALEERVKLLEAQMQQLISAGLQSGAPAQVPPASRAGVV